MASVFDVHYPTPSQPRQIRLDTVGNKCNASCLSCHRHLSNRKGEMPIDMIRDILKDVSKWGKLLEEIVPVNYGEFFLREDWFEILTMIAQKLPYTVITLATNGSLLTDKEVINLCQIPTFKIVNFSVNAYFEETYKEFMGLNPDTIQKIRKAMAQFRVLRPDIWTKVSMVFDPEYQTDLERDLFVNYWCGAGLSPVDYPDRLRDIWVITNSSAGKKGVKPLNPVKIPCRSIFSDFVIGYDGKLSSCCWDANFHLDLGSWSGNILKDWQNDKLTELRKLHNENKREEVDLCKVCTSA